jgi:hypothetical protein
MVKKRVEGKVVRMQVNGGDYEKKRWGEVRMRANRSKWKRKYRRRERRAGKGKKESEERNKRRE